MQLPLERLHVFDGMQHNGHRDEARDRAGQRDPEHGPFTFVLPLGIFGHVRVTPALHGHQRERRDESEAAEIPGDDAAGRWKKTGG